jgi:hypothetical protein
VSFEFYYKQGWRLGKDPQGQRTGDFNILTIFWWRILILSMISLFCPGWTEIMYTGGQEKQYGNDEILHEIYIHIQLVKERESRRAVKASQGFGKLHTGRKLSSAHAGT